MRKNKLFAIASLASLLGLSASASAALVTFTGDTTNGPTYDRALADFSGPSAVGTGVRYSTYSFTVTTNGNYTFVSSADLPPLWDNYTFLYINSFNPAAPTVNGVAGNDDNLSIGTSAFVAALTAGTPYVYVTTGFDSGDFGTFTNSINGPGSVVPEPTTLALLALAPAVVSRRRRA